MPTRATPTLFLIPVGYAQQARGLFFSDNVLFRSECELLRSFPDPWILRIHSDAVIPILRPCHISSEYGEDDHLNESSQSLYRA